MILPRAKPAQIRFCYNFDLTQFMWYNDIVQCRYLYSTVLQFLMFRILRQLFQNRIHPIEGELVDTRSYRPLT